MADPPEYFNSLKWSEEISDRVFYDPINHSYATWGLSYCPGTTDAGPWDGVVGFGGQVERDALDGITERGTLDWWADGCSPERDCPEEGGYTCAEVYAFAGMRVNLEDRFIDESERAEDIEWAELHHDLEIRNCCVPIRGWHQPGETRGCMDPGALNYDSSATYDDGSCKYLNEMEEDVVDGDVPYTDIEYTQVNSKKCELPEIEPIEIETSQTCFPNPVAQIPSWYSQQESVPFLNQKICEYWITMFADENDCSQEYLNTFVRPAVEKMLEYYNKEGMTEFTNYIDTTEDLSSIDVLMDGSDALYREGIKFTGTAEVKTSFISPRPLEKMRVLVSVDAEELNRIPEKRENFSLEPASAMRSDPSYVVFYTKDILRIFDVVEKSFRYFDSQYADWALQSGKIIKGLDFVSDSARLKDFYRELSSLLAESGYSYLTVDTIEIGFTEEYTIEYIRIKEMFRPPVALESGFSTFLYRPPMTNPTIMAYVSRLPDIKDDLLARETIGWYELLQKYRHPEIEEMYFNDVSSPTVEGNEGIKKLEEAACPQGAGVFTPKKNAGEWLLNEVGSIKDALMAQLRESPCALVDAKILEEKNRATLAMEVIDMTVKEYLSSDRIINDLPVMLVEEMFDNKDQYDGLSNLYKGLLNNLGYCGIIDLIMSAVDCLLNALGYDDAISIIIGAAVRGMDNANFGKFLASMPPDMLEAITASVRELAPQLLPLLQGIVIIEIVDDKGVAIKPVYDETNAYSYTSEGVYTRADATKEESNSPFIGQARNPDYPPATAQDWSTLNEIVYDLIINDLLNLDQLLDLINKFPGASIAIAAIQKLDKFCVVGPKFYPPLSDIIKLPGINIELCKLGDGMVHPIPGRFQVPKITMAALSSAILKNALKVMRALLKLLLILVIRRILEIIFEELCKQRVGADPLGLREALLSGCGNQLTPEEIDMAVADIANAMGVTDDPSIAGRLIDNLSSMLTECEMVDLINGTASENVYRIVIETIKADPITAPLASSLGDKQSITKLFRAIGTFIDLDALCITDPLDLPISQEVCDNLGLLGVFRDARAEALRNKGVPEECITDQLCQLRDKTKAELADMMNMLQNGILEDLVPDIVKDPKNPDKESLLPTLSVAAEFAMGSMFDSMFSGLSAEFTRDMIGRRGFLNMCLADSRGRGYAQHMSMQKLFGPATFNIYGSRGTRTYPPKDEWGDSGVENKADHNSWVKGPIPFTDEAVKFIWLPYLFNPLSSRDPDETEVEDEWVDEGVEAVGARKGRPPAIGGLPDKVAGYLEDELKKFSVTFDKSADYSIVVNWDDYDDDGYDFKFLYDYYAPPPEGIEPYDYDGYRLRIDATLSKEDAGPLRAGFDETLVQFKTSDPLPPEVSIYIRDKIIPSGRDWSPDKTWARLVENAYQNALEEDESPSPTIFNTLKGSDYKHITERFINEIAKEISETDIFDYGYDSESLPEVIYFHDDRGGEFNNDLPGAIEKYGGSEGNPPFYIKEPPATGFTKVARSIVPEFQPCEEDIETIQFPNFTELKDVANALTGKMRDDPRLARAGGDVTSIIEAPFNRALPAASVALNEALIFAVIRVYLVDILLKSIPVMNFMAPKYPDNYTNLISEYVIDAMEKGLVDTGRGIRYRDDYKSYWFLFLEQVVQSFLTKKEYNMIDDEVAEEAKALVSITDYVKRNWTGDAGYVYKKGDNETTKKEKRKNWEAVFTDSVIKNCKVILRRYVGEEITRMVPAFAGVMPPSRYNSVDELILISKNKPNVEEGIFPRTSYPFVTGALSEEEMGPVDVPSQEHFVSEGASGHPLDEIGGFEDRDWPFVLERYVVVKDKDLGPSVHNLGYIINIKDWYEYEANGGLVGKDWYFGMRLSYVPRESQRASMEFNDDDLRPGINYSDKAYSDLYKNLIPLVGVEKEISGIDSLEFTPNLYGQYVQALMCDLIETTEYKLIFKHCFPIARYLSFLAIYSANVFVPALGQVKDGWASTIGPKKNGGGQWIGLGIFGGMRTWRGNEGMKNSFKNTKKLLRQLFESTNNTNYLYKDRDSLSPQEQFVKSNKQSSDMDLGVKWWQWSSLRPPPCKDGDK